MMIDGFCGGGAHCLSGEEKTIVNSQTLWFWGTTGHSIYYGPPVIVIGGVCFSIGVVRGTKGHSLRYGQAVVLPTFHIGRAFLLLLFWGLFGIFFNSFSIFLFIL